MKVFPSLGRSYMPAIPAQPKQSSAGCEHHNAKRMQLSRFWLTNGCTQMMVKVWTGSFTRDALLMEFILQSWQLYFLILASWIN